MLDGLWQLFFRSATGPQNKRFAEREELRLHHMRERYATGERERRTVSGRIWQVTYCKAERHFWWNLIHFASIDRSCASEWFVDAKEE